MSLHTIQDSVSYGIFDEVAKKIARGETVLPLAIGEPSFNTPKAIVEAAYRGLKAGQVHYVSSYGIPEVREAIREKVARKNGLKALAENTIFLTTKLSVYAVAMALNSKGSEILVPDPGWFYAPAIQLAGALPVRYKLGDDFSLDLDNIKRRMSRKTRAIIVNSPANPTGKVYGRKELTELFGFCRDSKIKVVSDESYEDLVYEKKHFSVGSLEGRPENVVSLFSLSKSYAMTGWRAGYLVAESSFVKLVNRFIENTVSCFPPFIQLASAYALRRGDGYAAGFRDSLRRRRDMVERALKKMHGVESQRTEGAFYSFPRFLAKMNSMSFAKRLLREQNVAVLPGVIFGPSGEGHVRISFGSPDEVVREGLARLGRFLEGLRN